MTFEGAYETLRYRVQDVDQTELAADDNDGVKIERVDRPCDMVQLVRILTGRLF